MNARAGGVGGRPEDRTGVVEATVVWLSPSAVSFSCVCERCLEAARRQRLDFSQALQSASVRGSLPPDVDAVAVRCAAGHEIVLRRGERPAALARRDERQLSLA
jgi:hypothetical protein